MTCPISGVSFDCKNCSESMWKNCVYVKVWQARRKRSKSSPYQPLTIEKKEEKETKGKYCEKHCYHYAEYCWFCKKEEKETRGK